MDMNLRPHPSEDTTSHTFFLMLAIIAVVLGCSVRVQDDRYVSQYLERCKSQLEATNQLIKVAMSYKENTDKLIADTQEHYEAESENLKDMMQGCYIVTKQAIGCKNQLDALESKCTKIRVECQKLDNYLHHRQLHENITFAT